MWPRTSMVTLAIQPMHFWLKTQLFLIVFSLWAYSFFLGFVSVIHKPEFHRLCYNFELWVDCLFCYCYLPNTEKKSKILYLLLHILWKYKEMLKAVPHGGCRFEILLAQLSQPWNRSMATCQTELHDVDWGQAWQDLWGPSDFVAAYLPKVFNQKVLPWKLLPFVYHSESHLLM